MGCASWCPDCGGVDVAIDAFELHVNRREDFRIYAFSCPSCGQLTAGGDPVLLDRLLQAQVCVRELRSPYPSFVCDDLLELHQLLADEGWCARLAQGEL